MSEELKYLPDSAYFQNASARSFKTCDLVGTYLDRTLVRPVSELIKRPHKSIRAKLVEIGFELAKETQGVDSTLQAPTILPKLGAAIEFLHGGSLIIDDIQDGSLYRRGGPTIHRMYGIPQAIASGNWMYFYPLSIIRDLAVSEECKLRLYQAFHEATMTAHEGQSLDVSLRVSDLPQEDVGPLSDAVMDMKTGALTALGLGLGAIVAGVRDERLDQLLIFGRRFGVALQMFDDIGNLASQKDPDKRMEDLLNRRISFVWGFAAKQMSKEQYGEFLRLVALLPDDSRMQEFLNSCEFMSRAKAHAAKFLNESLSMLRASWPELTMECAPMRQLVSLGEILNHAF